MPEKSSRRYSVYAVGIVLAAGLIVYSNTFLSAFHFDDHPYIVRNSAITDIRHLGKIWHYFPTRFITFLTFALNYHFDKLNVFWYHAVNLCIHLGAALAVRRLTLLIFLTPVMQKDKLSRYSRAIALWVSLIFLTHPVQTESVTYLSQRSTILFVFLYFLSLCLYLASRLPRTGNNQRYFFYALSWFLGLLCQVTKENAVTLPLLICLCEIFFFKEHTVVQWKKIAPFAVLIPISPVLFFLSRPKTFIDMQEVISRPGSFGNGLCTQLRVLLTYIRLLFLPFNQNLDYDYPVYKSLLHPAVLAGFIALILFIVSAVRLFRHHRLISFGIVWFVLTLLPEWGIVPLGDAIFEHRLYLSMAGFGFFLVGGVYTPAQASSVKWVNRLCAAAIILFSLLAFQRNNIWKDEFTLWNDVIRKSGHKARPYTNRGNAYFDNGDFSLAIRDYTSQIAYETKSAEAAHVNRGLAYQRLGNIEAAVSDYNKSLELSPRGDTGVYSYRGNAYLALGAFAKAIADYDTAIDMNPNRAENYYNRGFVYQIKGDLDHAMADYNRALKIDPQYARPYNNRGLIYQSRGDNARALADYNKAIELNPGLAETYYNRGFVYQVQGDLDRAVADYDRALKINPRYAKPYNSRGFIHQGKGDSDAAIADYTKAVEFNPSFGEAYYNRGRAYLEKHEYGKSLNDLLMAQRLGRMIDPGLIKGVREGAQEAVVYGARVKGLGSREKPYILHP